MRLQLPNLPQHGHFLSLLRMSQLKIMVQEPIKIYGFWINERIWRRLAWPSWVWAPSKLKTNDFRRRDDNLMFGPSWSIFVEMVRDARNEIVVGGTASHFDADDHSVLPVVGYPRSTRNPVWESESYLAMSKCEEVPVRYREIDYGEIDYSKKKNRQQTQCPRPLAFGLQDVVRWARRYS